MGLKLHSSKRILTFGVRIRHARIRYRVLNYSFLLISILLLLGFIKFYPDFKEIYLVNDKIFQPILEFQNPANTIVYDREEKKLGEFFENYQMYLPYEKIPKSVINILLAVEDRKFFKHQGVDLQGMLRAAYNTIQSNFQKKEGASTITQQLVRYFLLSHEKSLQRKLKEIRLALLLEQKISKERILEIYLNSMFFGNGAYGISAASKRYFNREIEKLSLGEIAFLVGLLKSPSAYNPLTKMGSAMKRRISILFAMKEMKIINHHEFDKLKQEPIQLNLFYASNENKAPYFLDYIKSESQKILKLSDLELRKAGLKIYTTLDATSQEIAEKTFQKYEIRFLEWDARQKKLNGYDKSQQSKSEKDIQGALLSMNSQTGEIISMVGGRNYQDSQFNRTTQSLRSPGSAFKPVVYSYALNSGMKWSDMSLVSPITIQDYRPDNMGDHYVSETTLLRAFYKSYNTTTVEVANRLGLDEILKFAQQLGIRTELKEEIGTVIGGSEVSMMDLLRLYSVFSNQGKLQEPQVIKKIVSREGKTLYEYLALEKNMSQVLSKEISYLMHEGMRSVFLYGTASEYRSMGNLYAGKTGTSSNSTDNWFSGYSDKVTTVVWVGSDRHQELKGKFLGSNTALPIWVNYMENIQAIYPPEKIKMPDHIEKQKVHPVYGFSSEDRGIDMYFLQGQKPSTANHAYDAIHREKNFRDIF